MNKKQKKTLYRIIVATVIMIALAMIPVEDNLRFILFMIPYAIIGYDILKKAFKGICNGKVFDENFLMAVATIGAIVLGEYTEAVAVMLFYQIGELFQSCAVGKSRKNISQLMDIRPDYANLEKDGTVETVDPDEVEIGSIILVKPGERVPLDGIVIEGSSSLNTSALTGESVPREIEEGQEVISGCINMTGVLRIRTTKVFEESTVAKILDLVENASSRKSKSEQFITKFSKYYTPAVCYTALALAVIPPMIQYLLISEADLFTWIYRALTFLVISCPCALVISIPLTFFAGIGAASHRGILIKGSNYIETLANAKYIILDKTGTVTHGVFTVNDIHYGKIDHEKLIEYAAIAEHYSNHPIAFSLKEAYGKEIDESRIGTVEEIAGNGVVTYIDGIRIAAGNSKLMEKIGITCKECHGSGTIVHIAIENDYAGHVVISDTIKENSFDIVRKFKDCGISKVIMLTGDSKMVAEDVAGKLGMDEVYAELLPGDKVEKVELLMGEKDDNHKLIFVGDGINDAPVLTRADVGVAMGAIGSDAAIEAADVVIMDDDLAKVAEGIGISKKCMRIVYQNIVFAIGIKFLCLVLGAIGITNMWIAIFADVGVMVIAVLNAVRILYRVKTKGE